MSKNPPQDKSVQPQGPIHYPLWFGGSASCFAACVTHPLDLLKVSKAGLRGMQHLLTDSRLDYKHNPMMDREKAWPKWACTSSKRAE